MNIWNRVDTERPDAAQLQICPFSLCSQWLLAWIITISPATAYSTTETQTSSAVFLLAFSLLLILYLLFSSFFFPLYVGKSQPKQIEKGKNHSTFPLRNAPLELDYF